MRIAAAVLVITCCILDAPPAAAQSPARLTAVTAAAAPVYVLPDAGRTPLRTLPPGTRLRVLREQGEWLRVEFDDPWWGVRVGYIERRFVEMSDEIAEPAAPVDAPPMTPRTAPAPRRAPPARRVTFERVWIDANGGGAFARRRDFSLVSTPQINGQEARFQVDYHLPPGPAYDIGAGVMITRQVGIGVTLAGAMHEDPADLEIDIPHPILQGANATDTSVTARALSRRESSLHLHGMLVAQTSPELRARVFGGPTYFRLEQDLVREIQYDQFFDPFTPAHSVEITSVSIGRVPYADATGWGFHAGADAAWFFTRGLGIGVFGRYSHGTVELSDAVAGSRLDLDVGGFQVGAGVRLKF